LQNSPLESSCVVVALIENYGTSKPLNVSPEKSQILSCDIVVANERYGPLKMKALCFFEKSGINYPVTERHIPEGRSPQPQNTETCRSRKI
jgi:hypothetical protein